MARIGGVVTAIVLVVAALLGGVPIAGAAAIAATVPAALVDLDTRRLPDRLLAGALAAMAVGAIVGAFAGDRLDPRHVAVGATAMAAPLLAIHLASPRSMGFGDVKAAALLGAAVGTIHWQLALTALALAAGASATVALLAGARTIAFGPGLVAGAAAALVFHSVMLPTGGGVVS